MPREYRPGHRDHARQDSAKDLGWQLPDVYIPLLFLALDGQCNLRQEEFFGDIWVHVVKTDEQPQAESRD